VTPASDWAALGLPSSSAKLMPLLPRVLSVDGYDSFDSFDS
jgi:hypothetical protein